MGILKWKTNTRSGCLLKTFTKVMVHRGYVCGGDLNLMLWVMEKQGGNDFKFEEVVILRGGFGTM